jgi:ATP diphosphatase
VTEGIPAALPALALAAELQRKARSVGLEPPDPAELRRLFTEALDELDGPATDASEAVGELLFVLADAARRRGVDPESALRARAGRFRRQVESSEAGTAPG